MPSGQEMDHAYLQSTACEAHTGHLGDNALPHHRVTADHYDIRK